VNAAAFTAPLEQMPVVVPPVVEPLPRDTSTPLGDFIPDVTETTPLEKVVPIAGPEIRSPDQILEDAKQENTKQVDWLRARQGEYQLPEFFDGSGTDLGAAMEIQTPSDFQISDFTGDGGLAPEVAARKKQLNDKGFNIEPTQNVVDATPGALGGGKEGGWNVLEQLGGVAGFVGRAFGALGTEISEVGRNDFWKGATPKRVEEIRAGAFNPKTFNPSEKTVLQGLMPTKSGTNLSKGTFGDYGTGLVGALNYGMDTLLGGNTVRGVIADVKRNQTRAKQGLAPEWGGVGQALSGKTFSFVDANSPNNLTGTKKTGGEFWGAFAGGLALDVVTDINPLNSIRRAGVTGLRKAAVKAAKDSAVKTTRLSTTKAIIGAAVQGLDNPLIDIATALAKPKKATKLITGAPALPALAPSARQPINVAVRKPFNVAPRAKPLAKSRTPLLGQVLPELTAKKPMANLDANPLTDARKLPELTPKATGASDIPPQSTPQSPSPSQAPSPAGTPARTSPPVEAQPVEFGKPLEPGAPPASVAPDAPAPPASAVDNSLSPSTQPQKPVAETVQPTPESPALTPSSLPSPVVESSPMVAALRTVDKEVATPAGISDASARLLSDPVAVPAVLQEAARVAAIKVDPDTGVIKRGADAATESERQLARLRVQQGELRALPNFEQRTQLQEAYNKLQQEVLDITGRDTSEVTSELIDAALPVIGLDTFTPSTNPSLLYSELKNLTPGSGVYTSTAEFVERSNQDLTELARFLGHYVGDRKQPLNADQLDDLRMRHGSVYGNVGHPIDTKALRQYAKTGVGRIETKQASAATGAAQESLVINRLPDPVDAPSTSGSDAVTVDLESELNSLYEQANTLDPDVDVDELMDIDARAADIEGELEQSYARQALGTKPYKQFEAVLPDSKQPTTPLAKQQAAVVHQTEMSVADEMSRVRAYTLEAVAIERAVDEDMAKLSAMPRVEPADLDVGSYDTGLVNDRVVAVVKPAGVPDEFGIDIDALDKQVADALKGMETNLKGAARSIVEADLQRASLYEQGLRELGVPDAAVLGTRLAEASVIKRNIEGLVAVGYNKSEIGEVFGVAPKKSGSKLVQSLEAATNKLKGISDSIGDLKKLNNDIYENTAEIVDSALKTGYAYGGGAASTFYHGTKFDTPLIGGAADVMPTRNPLGLGHYFHSNPDRATDAAKSRLSSNVPLTNTPVDEIGSVREVAPNITKTLDANLDSTPELKGVFEAAARAAGFDAEVIKSFKRRLSVTKKLKDGTQIKSKVADQWNKLSAAYAKINPGESMPEDMFRQFELNVQARLEDLGFDSIKHTTGEGDTLVVFNANNVDELARTPVGTGSQLEQSAAAVNQSVYHQGITVDVVSKVAAMDAKVALGTELLTQTDEIIEAASERADNAITRMLEADDALEATVMAAQKDASQRTLQDGMASYAKQIDEIDITEYPGCL